MSAQYNERVVNIESTLLIQNLHIDEPALRKSCAYGIPDKFRPLIWRLFLGYLPPKREEWTPVLKQQREHYAHLAEHFVAAETPSGSGAADMADPLVVPGALNGGNPEGTDHPLAFDQHSRWTSYFRDNELLKQIENDVRRLRPEIDFFQRRTRYPMRNIPANLRLSKRVNNTTFLPSNNGCALQVDKLANKSFISDYPPASRRSIKSPNNNNTGGKNGVAIDGNDGDENGEMHWEVVERILFVYSKVNTAVKYVQGIHEILGPIYFVFATDADQEWSMHAEADSFFCFHNLLVEFQDIFIRRMDSEHCGIAAALTHFYTLLADNDPVLYRHLEQQQMKAEYYGFRWISLLLSQEFSLPDVIALWDTVFCSPNGKRLLSVEYICLSMLEMLRDQLLDGDFQSNVKMLQNFPERIDVSHLVIRSLEIAAGLTLHNRQHQQHQQKQQQHGKGKSRFARISSSIGNGNGIVGGAGKGKRLLGGILSDASAIRSRITTPLRGLVAETAVMKFLRHDGGGGGEGKAVASNDDGTGTGTGEKEEEEEPRPRNATL